MSLGAAPILNRLAVALVLGSSLLAAPADSATLPSNFVDDTMVSGLDQPNAMAFLPDGRLLLTELETGKIRMVVNGHLAATDPVLVVDSVSTEDFERGLQGIAVDPRWPSYPYVYVCHTQTGGRIRLLRYTASGDITNPSGENLTLGSRRVLIHNISDQATNHNGLGLRFGTDGKLLMTTGDDNNRCTAQSLTSLNGKLLRIDVTRVPAGGGGPPPKWALIPSDNPIASPDSNARLVYAYGFRNPWRFHVDSELGKIVVGDVGESSYEELSVITAGGNYGWPFREGPLTRSVTGCTDVGGYTSPFHSLDRATGYAAVLTAGIYRPVAGAVLPWPSLYNGSLFYTDYINNRMRRMVPSGSTYVPAPAVPGQPNSQDWATGTNFAVDFAVGKDGCLWWLRAFNDAGSARTGSVRRMRYYGTVDVPLATANPRTLTAWPNPFREQVEIAWRLPAPGEARMRIFDLGGRRVRELPVTSAGVEGRMSWDGRDHHGAATPAGIYLARLDHAGGTETIRLLRVR